MSILNFQQNRLEEQKNNNQYGQKESNLIDSRGTSIHPLSTSQYQELSQNYINNMQLTNKILEEIKQIKNEMKKNDIQPQKKIQESPSSKQLLKINYLELELQKLMQSDIISDKNNQIQLFQLVKNFQQLKNDLLLNITQESGNQTYNLLKGRLNQLESQFQNMAKACLHAPNILGYVTNGKQHIGLIDKKGQIDYIQKSDKNQRPQYIALRNSKTPKQPMTLPSVIDYINQPQNKNHKLIGQLTDSSQQLSIGLIMEKQNQQYLLLISPIPKLSNIPVMAITFSHKMVTETQPTQRQQDCPSQSKQKCLPGLQSSVYQGDSNWLPSNDHLNQQQREKNKLIADSFDQQLFNDPQFDYLDSA